MNRKYVIAAFLVTLLSSISCSDITRAVFGDVLDGMPAAFGDFNSDELTDVFVLRKERKTLEILLASDQEPLLQPNVNLSCTFKDFVTSVVPGDFDGDVFMDVLVTTFNRETKAMRAHILWGGTGQINCPNETDPMVEMHGQPLTVDYNQDMIIDLFGLNTEDQRTFWIFNKNRTSPTAIPMEPSHELRTLLPIRKPHANAFLDLNADFLPDLVVTTKKYFEVWRGISNGFVFNHTIELPYNITNRTSFPGHIGQSLYLDVELTGKIELVLPICTTADCESSAIMIHSDGVWHNLDIKFQDNDHVTWGFVPHDAISHLYTDTITLRGGDFNMDGYPDLLATLRSHPRNPANSQTRSFLLLNTPCNTCGDFNRTFQVRWNALSPFNNESVMAVFYDFYQDGILDVILVEFDKTNNNYKTAAFKNSLDYDANFVKVMVLTGLTNSKYPISPGTLGKKKRTYGTNLPGPSIAYKTITQDGSPRSAIAAQLPQSAHFSLNLPYTTFGLGRTPNFIDTLTIGVSGKLREWPQIIPNSQMVVIPNPISEPTRWKAQLFVTPSKLILLSVIALTATCGLIAVIIIGLYWKERREDKIERLQEAHRFHFDAM
ncbi:T-cell immunomodulatory protein [Venturia canescens]|uniref:T-cell immunomodulatory protein n=1 Tax=Venturia canescens TaxID=32260 RepID=UPI001C9D3E91|nr:T-cell immunomodulatory protein [Venturia canescens]